MKAVGLFVDINNLFYWAKKNFDGGKINYEEFLKKALGDDMPHTIIAYGYNEANSEKFKNCLKQFGYDVKYIDIPENKRKTSNSMRIATDVFRVIDKLDVVILGTSNIEMIHLIQWIKERGAKARVMACGIPREMKAACDNWTEINKAFLHEEPVELPTDGGSENTEPES